MEVGFELQPAVNNKSGVGWYTHELVKYTAAMERIKCTGYVFDFKERNNAVSSFAHMKGLNLRVNRWLPFGVYRRIWNYLRIDYNQIIGGNSDIYHFFNYIVPPRIKGKIIVTVYDMVYKLYPETMEAVTRKRLENELIRSVKRADRIITISENSKREIVKLLNIPAEKIRIVPPGIEPELYMNIPTLKEIETFRKRWCLPENYVLYLGTLEPRKNITSLLYAFEVFVKEHPQYKLVIAGSKGWKNSQLSETIVRLGLEDTVIMTGYIPEEDKVLFYKCAEIFVFPSLYEGFGMPILEAMASGTPVIAGDNSAMTELGNGCCHLVDATDSNQIANGMIRLVEDEAYRKSLIQKSIIRAKEYTWEKSAQLLMQVYWEVGADSK